MKQLLRIILLISILSPLLTCGDDGATEAQETSKEQQATEAIATDENTIQDETKQTDADTPEENPGVAYENKQD
jgi:hypothetical protein